MWRVAWVAGTRPELIKMSPIVEELERLSEIELIFVWSGQHYDYEMAGRFVDELKLPRPDYNLEVGSKNDSEQIATIIAKVGKVLDEAKPNVVLAEGDTNTIAGTAIAASKQKVPFAHVEAGLRSFDRRMPEEINRKLAALCAELHFAPTRTASTNLRNEGIPAGKIHQTGNTVVDAVANASKSLKMRGEKGGHILATVHRQETVDSPDALANVVRLLKDLGEVSEVILPIHPRTRARLVQFGLLESVTRTPNIRTTGPMGYGDFLTLLASSGLVVTDSGGVQEEAYIFNKPTLTLRDNTERPETVLYGKNVLVGASPSDLRGKAREMIETGKERSPTIPNALGDGTAGRQIAKILLESLERGLSVPHHMNLEPSEA